MKSGCCNNLIPDFNHGLVESLWIASQLKLTIFVNVSEPRQHVCAGNSYLVKHQPAIVLLLVTEFWTNVANSYTWKRKVSFSVSNLNHKSLNSVRFIADVALCKNDCMICPESKTTWPEFCACHSRRMNDELVSCQIKNSSGFQTCNV